jgi:acetyltransferase-like isoleucine patch superfamily enzyme
MNSSLDTPVLFLVFNRPTLTEWVFQAIRDARPKKLYLAADGPRSDRPDEAVRCELVRNVVSKVDWPCEVFRLYQVQNLGCKRAVSQAISWFFEHEEEGIILEDDVLPDTAFFGFCAKMLAAHRGDTRVMHISGFNFLGDPEQADRDYFFCRFGSIWGWATWRRAWQVYRVEMDGWRAHRKAAYRYFPRAIWKDRDRLYNRLALGAIDTWDYQWTFWRLVHGGLAIMPTKNLVRNIGSGPDSTHVRSMPKWADVPLETLELEKLRINNDLCVNELYDQRFLATAHPRKSRFRNLFNCVKGRIFASVPRAELPPFQVKDWTAKLPLKIRHIGGMPPAMRIGRGTYANGMTIYCWNPTVKVTFGKYCAIADQVTLVAGGEHHKDWVTSYQFVDLWQIWDLYTHLKPKTKGNILIGNDVWIGTSAIILSGVTIGDGAVIGAGSVVVKDVPPYAIVGGNPARVIRFRFTEEQVRALLNIRWWDWPEKHIREQLASFMDVDSFISREGRKCERV